MPWLPFGLGHAVGSHDAKPAILIGRMHDQRLRDASLFDVLNL